MSKDELFDTAVVGYSVCYPQTPLIDCRQAVEEMDEQERKEYADYLDRVYKDY